MSCQSSPSKTDASVDTSYNAIEDTGSQPDTDSGSETDTDIDADTENDTDTRTEAKPVFPSLLGEAAILDFEAAPLARQLTLATDIPVSVRVEVFEGESLAWTRDFAGLSTDHALPLLGFKPDRSYSVQVTLTTEAGAILSLDEPLEVSTAPLPDDWPPIQITMSQPERMEPGFTLFGLRTPGGGTPYIVILDALGDVVWYMRGSTPEVRQLEDGNLVYLVRNQIRVIDVFAQTRLNYHGTITTEPEDGSIAVDTLRFHHEVFPMEDGNFVTLSKESLWAVGRSHGASGFQVFMGTRS